MHSLTRIALATLVFLLPSGLAQDTSLVAVKQAFDKADIPSRATIAFDPDTLFEVAFTQPSGPPVKVKAGIQLQRPQVAIPPSFGIPAAFPAARSGGKFVVAMVDLDAPTPQQPNVSQIRHFLGGDFTPLRPNAAGVALLSNSSPALSEFQQPTPPAGSDPHRYVFFLFEQSRAFATQKLINTTTPITSFNISQFALEVGLGQPLGGTFMLVGPDPA